MRYKNAIKKISDTLKTWKNKLDEMEKNYIREKQNVDNYAASMKEQWTDSYIEQYIQQHSPDSKYRAKYAEEKAKISPIVHHYLEVLQKQIDKFFNSPISAEFSNKITAIKLTGLQLSDLEFRLLKDSVSTYAEARLLNQLATTRIKKADAVKLENGMPKTVSEEVADPYLFLNVPDIEEVYNGFDSFKSMALGLLNSYAGKNAKLNFALETEKPYFICIAMDAYFRTKADEKLLETMDKASSILQENRKNAINSSEKEAIDRLLSPFSKTKETILWAASIHEDIEEILRLDPRYSNFFDVEE